MRRARPVPLPGFVNSHSHAFQRALRGRASGTDFWTWRDGMLEEADRATPDSVRAYYAAVYREMRAAGFTAVGEFHYLGAAEAFAAADGGGRRGHRDRAPPRRVRARRPRPDAPAVLDAYLAEVESLRGAGIAVGVAPHSVRACSRAWLEGIGRYAAAEGLPLHIHADEQPREIEECLAEHGCRPIELLAETGCLGPHTTIVHATHADDHELDLLAEHGSRICACPTTEADLGDGFLRVEAVRERGDPALHRLGLEHAHRPARGAARDRGHRAPPDRPARHPDDGGAPRHRLRPRAPGRSDLDAWAPIEIDAGHRSLAGVPGEHLEAALIAGCCGGRLRDGGCLTDGRHRGDLRARTSSSGRRRRR